MVVRRSAKKPGRRAPGEVPTLLLESARELFASKGYAGASTREIATRAGVSEALLFRHFGNKAGLFDRAIIEPFRDFIADYVTTWEKYAPEDRNVEELCRDFISGLYDLLRTHRELVVALVTAHAYEEEVVDGGRRGLGRELHAALTRLERVAEIEAERHSLPGLDPPLTVGVTVGMVMATAVLDEWLFPGSRRPSRERLVREMTTYMAHGIANR